MDEAAVLAVRIFREHDCEPGALSKLEVEIKGSVTHTVTLKRIHEWVSGGAKSPKEAVIKERLREMLSATSRQRVATAFTHLGML